MPSKASLRASLLSLGALLLPGAGLSGQAITPHRSGVTYWLTAGAGVGTMTDKGVIGGRNGTALAAAGSVQYRAFVASARWARASDDPGAVWDVGVLAGVGTSPRPAVRGSIAAGLGRVESRLDGSGVAVPVELQLTWRITPTLGAGIYTFGSFGGPAEFVGAAFAVQIGRLR